MSSFRMENVRSALPSLRWCGPGGAMGIVVESGQVHASNYQQWSPVGLGNYFKTSAELAKIEKCFAFKDPGMVISFLSRNKFLAELLLEIHQQVGKYFNESLVSVTLEIYRGADTGEEDQLFVMVKSSQDSESAYKCLARLDEEWWLRELPRAEGKMVISVEFADV